MNAQNAQVALDNLYKQLDLLAPSIYDYKIEVGDPSVDPSDGNYSFIPIKILYYANDNTATFGDIINNTLDGIRINESATQAISKQGNTLWRYYRSTKKREVKTATQIRCILPINEGTLEWHYCPLDEDRLKSIFRTALLRFSIKDNTGGEYALDNAQNIIEEGSIKNLSQKFYFDASFFLGLTNAVKKWDSFPFKNLLILITDFNHPSGELYIPQRRFNLECRQVIWRGFSRFPFLLV